MIGPDYLPQNRTTTATHKYSVQIATRHLYYAKCVIDSESYYLIFSCSLVLVNHQSYYTQFINGDSTM